MDKRGIRLLGNTTIEVIIALVIVAVVLFAGFKILGNIFDNNKEARAEDQLDKFETVAEEVFQSGEEKSVEIFPPDKKWVFRSFPDYNFPLGQCRNSIGCVCMCEGVDCESLIQCRGFPFDIEVVGDYSETDTQLSAVSGGVSSTNEYKSVLELSPIQKLDVFREGEIVKIRRGK